MLKNPVTQSVAYAKKYVYELYGDYGGLNNSTIKGDSTVKN